MNKRRFWVRTASADGAIAMTAHWKVKPLVREYPGYMGGLSAYHSTLDAGHTPHDLHPHEEEEIYVSLSGALDVVTSERDLRIRPGGFVYVPPGEWHTSRGVGQESAQFLILKWTWQNPTRRPKTPGLRVFNMEDLEPSGEDAGIRRHRVCENQPLANGGRLAVEAIRLAPRTGYPTHAHEHDLMLVLLSGEMHALGHTTSAPAVIYYPAGTVHGLAPLNPDPIDMLAFEFHRPASTSPSSV